MTYENANGYFVKLGVKNITIFFRFTFVDIFYFRVTYDRNQRVVISDCAVTQCDTVTYDLAVSLPSKETIYCFRKSL